MPVALNADILKEALSIVGNNNSNIKNKNPVSDFPARAELYSSQSRGETLEVMGIQEVHVLLCVLHSAQTVRHDDTNGISPS